MAQTQRELVPFLAFCQQNAVVQLSRAWRSCLSAALLSIQALLLSSQSSRSRCFNRKCIKECLKYHKLYHLKSYPTYHNHILLYYIISYHIIYHIISIISYHVVPYPTYRINHIILYQSYIILYHIISIILYHIILYHIILYQSYNISCHIISIIYYIISYYINHILYHIVSYQSYIIS